MHSDILQHQSILTQNTTDFQQHRNVTALNRFYPNVLPDNNKTLPNGFLGANAAAAAALWNPYAGAAAADLQQQREIGDRLSAYHEALNRQLFDGRNLPATVGLNGGSGYLPAGLPFSSNAGPVGPPPLIPNSHSSMLPDTLSRLSHSSTSAGNVSGTNR